MAAREGKLGALRNSICQERAWILQSVLPPNVQRGIADLPLATVGKDDERFRPQMPNQCSDSPCAGAFVFDVNSTVSFELSALEACDRNCLLDYAAILRRIEILNDRLIAAAVA